MVSRDSYGLCEHHHIVPCPYCKILELRREIRWLEVSRDALIIQRDRAVSDLRRLQYRQKKIRADRYRETGS